MLDFKKIVMPLFAVLISLPSIAGVADTLVNPDRFAEMVIEEGMTHKGKPYHYGSRGPNAFDCSGFVGYVYGRYGFSLPRSSWQMAEVGEAVEGSISNLQKGDIVLFSGRGVSKKVGHVGIYIGPSGKSDDFIFIHAAIKGGVQVSHITEEYYAKRFLGARRLIPTFFVTPEPESELAVERKLDIANVTESVRDTLSLGANDMRLILLSTGEWLMVAPDGTLSKPDASTSRFVINPDGSWFENKLSRVGIPSSSVTNTAVADTVNAVADTLTTTGVAAVAVQPAVETPKELYHTVKKGETLSSISRKYGTSVKDLCSLNGMTAKSVLKIGKKLRVK